MTDDCKRCDAVEEVLMIRTMRLRRALALLDAEIVHLQDLRDEFEREADLLEGIPDSDLVIEE